jgi:hypothetical protein
VILFEFVVRQRRIAKATAFKTVVVVVVVVVVAAALALGLGLEALEVAVSYARY